MPNAVNIFLTPLDASSHKKCAAWGQLWFLHQKLHFSYICRVLKYHFFHSHSHVWSNLSVLFHTVKEAKSIRILFDTLIDTLIVYRIYYISCLCLEPCLSWHVATVECEISASFLPPPLAPGRWSWHCDALGSGSGGSGVAAVGSLGPVSAGPRPAMVRL